MKKITLMLMLLTMSVASFAQFERGKKYIGASLSSFDLSYNGLHNGNIGIDAKGGYLFADDLMLTAQISYEKTKNVPAFFSAGVGGRYYIIQNGIYLGAGCKYTHSARYDDFMPSVQIGYAFFISHTVTVEPEIYYNQSFKNHKDYSTFGLRVGLGIYL